MNMLMIMFDIHVSVEGSGDYPSASFTAQRIRNLEVLFVSKLGDTRRLFPAARTSIAIHTVRYTLG